ncbi:MAG: hypothetical protein AAGA20_09295 [Planctomycetota bacterium]
MTDKRSIARIVPAGALLLAAWYAAGQAEAQERPLLDPASGDRLLFQPPAPPAPDDVLMLKLRDGSIRWGSIESHDVQAFEFVRLDNGGRVGVPWSLIDPGQAEELRTLYGYVEVEAEEALIDAERLLLQGGGIVEGVILSREGDSFLVKTDGNLQMVPKRRVRSVESGVRLSALDVYSREELYGIYSAETDLTSAEMNLELARRCESILDFIHAVEHFEKALELGLSVDVDKVEGMLARARIKAQNQEQIEYLREADRLRKRNRFDDALALLQAFPEQFEGSSLLEDARKQEVRTLEARDEALKDLVRTRWNHWARKLTREKARDDSFQAARTWAVEQASAEILQRVVGDVNARITQAANVEDVQRAWEDRRRVRYASTTYGNGTWLLGRERAQQGGVEEEESAEGAVSEIDEQRKAIEDRIKRYMENQRIARRSAASEQAEDESQVFWETWSSNNRAAWLLSYYVEESGDYELRPLPSLRNCKTCGGRGAVELLITGTVTGQQSSSVGTCPLCRGVQVKRRVYYR